MRGTIKSSDEIAILFKTAEKHKSLGMMLLIDTAKEERGQVFGRVAFIAGKKLGNSPMRNRAKRIMRGIANDLDLPYPGWDVVFVANKNIFDCDFKEMVSRCENILGRATGMHRESK